MPRGRLRLDGESARLETDTNVLLMVTDPSGKVSDRGIAQAYARYAPKGNNVNITVSGTTDTVSGYGAVLHI